MDTDAVQEASVSLDDAKTGDPERASSKTDLVVEVSSNGETSGELGTACEILSRVELDLACASEKLVNLNVLVMRVATREIDFETFASTKEDAVDELVEKALEFDLLSGLLDSEVIELDKYMTILHRDIVATGEMISSCENLGEDFVGMEEKLQDCESSLKQSQDQVSEIRTQSVKFQRILFQDGEEIWHGDKQSNLEDGQDLNVNKKISMQTVEQQRHILRMLEKSLAREMDLEKKVAELRQIEKELNHGLLSAKQEVFFMEEDAMDLWGRRFEAENAAEVLIGISKELLGRIQVIQFNLNGSVQRETQLKSKLEKSAEELEAKETALQKFDSSSGKLHDFLVAQTDNLKACLTEAEKKLILADSEAFTLREKVSLLEKQLKDYEDQLLTANEDLVHQKVTSEMVDSLERKLKESDLKLQHAVATVEASQEKQSMLYSTIEDMENLFEKLKLKAAQAEIRADSAEDKCIMLSESNAELNEELSFLRGRLECLEASLNQAEETKMATAVDIGIHTKVITNLVMQLAIERERLHKQVSSLALELQQARKKPSAVDNHGDRSSSENTFLPDHRVAKISATGSEFDGTKKKVLDAESEVAAADSTSKLDKADSTSKLDNVRRVDAGVLGFKHVFLAILVLLLSAAVYIFLPENSPLMAWTYFNRL